MIKATKVVAVVAVAFLGLSTDALAAKRSKTRLELSGQLNLNTATQTQLDQLPGVGEKAAKRIIDQRTKAPFAKAEDLMKVKGIGKKKFEKLKSHLTVSGPTTLTVRRVTNGPDLPASNGLSSSPEAQGRASPIKR